MAQKIKNGYLYRTKQGGGPMLRIRKADKTTSQQSLADRVAKDPALLQKALANPGLRSKLPDKYLSPQQRQQRSDRLFEEDLGDPSTPLAGSSITRAAQQLTDALSERTDPAEAPRAPKNNKPKNQGGKQNNNNGGKKNRK